MKQPQLLVLAAGMGSRFGGLKQMEGVGPSGEVLLEYSFYDFWKQGAYEVVVLLRPGLEEVFEERIARHWRDRLEIRYAFQEIQVPGAHPERTKPWGTGHAVLAAAQQIDAPFLVINADDYYGQQAFVQGVSFLRKQVTEKKYGLVGFRLHQTLRGQLPVSRGICQVNEQGGLLDVQECPYVNRDEQGQVIGGKDLHTAEPLPADVWTSVNFWAFHPSVFTLLQEQFQEFWQESSQSLKSEFFLPTAIGKEIGRERINVSLQQQEGEWLGLTYREDLEFVRACLMEAHQNGNYPPTLRGE